MNRLFISYSYIGKQGGVFYNGFGSMVGHKLIYAPQDAGHIEALEEETREHCKKTLGMGEATTTILWWKTMDGS